MKRLSLSIILMLCAVKGMALTATEIANCKNNVDIESHSTCLYTWDGAGASGTTGSQCKGSLGNPINADYVNATNNCDSGSMIVYQLQETLSNGKIIFHNRLVRNASPIGAAPTRIFGLSAASLSPSFVTCYRRAPTSQDPAVFNKWLDPNAIPHFYEYLDYPERTPSCNGVTTNVNLRFTVTETFASGTYHYHIALDRHNQGYSYAAAGHTPIYMCRGNGTAATNVNTGHEYYSWASNCGGDVVIGLHGYGVRVK